MRQLAAEERKCAPASLSSAVQPSGAYASALPQAATLQGAAVQKGDGAAADEQEEGAGGLEERPEQSDIAFTYEHHNAVTEDLERQLRELEEPDPQSDAQQMATVG